MNDKAARRANDQWPGDALLRAAFDATDEAVFVIDPETLAYADLNEAACRLLGHDRAALLRMGAGGVFAQQTGGNPDDLRQHYRALIAGSAPAAHHGMVFVRPDGTRASTFARREARRVDGRWWIVSCVRADPSLEADSAPAQERWQASFDAIAVARDTSTQRTAQDELARFRAAVDQGDGILLVEPDSLRCIDANATAAAFFGRTRDQVIGMRVPEVVGQLQVDEDQLRSVYQKVIRDAPATCIAHLRSTRPDGSVVHTEHSRRAIRFDGAWLIVSMFRDITHRVAAEAALARFRAAVDQAAEGIVVADAETLDIVDANRTACGMAGDTRDEFMARGLSGIVQLASDADRRTFVESLRRKHPGHETLRLALPRRDGGTARLEIVMRAVQVDERWLIVGSMRDVGERDRTRAALERFGHVMNLSGEAIFMVDRLTMRFVDVNDSACIMWGWPREEIMALEPQQGVKGAARQDLERLYDEAIAQSPRMVRGEFTGLRRDGSEFPCEVHRQALLSEGRWVIVATVRDITERRRSETEIQRHIADLQRSNQELERFAYIASHDLSEPLRMVGSYVQLLQRRYGARLDRDAHEFIGFATGGVQRMKRLIDDLLLYSRAGRASGPLGDVNLDDALEDALANLSRAIEESGAQIVHDPLPIVRGERTAMMRLFQNLVGNAIKFRSDAPCRIEVRAQAEGDHWLISVRDNGIGIAAEQQQRIFVIFQRLHQRDRYEGTGIGLSICKKIVERHGGEISVESVPREGSVFRFSLPRL